MTKLRKPLVVANWKMNLDLRSLERFFDHFNIDESDLKKVNVLLCPSLVFLDRVKDMIGSLSISIGAQNIFWEVQGAYTGEVSARQLSDINCDNVILGHSERREIFSENDKMVNQKVKLALHHKISPIICLGENFEEKEAGLTKKVVEEKVRAVLVGINSVDIKGVTIAYEPIWAISTSSTNKNSQPDSPESAQVVHKLIRRIISEMFDEKVASSISIIYGGSINPDNVEGFAKMEDIDGVLVGSASREASKFISIIKAYL